MSLLWVQKYRPTSLEELDVHTKLTGTLRNLASGDELPHLLLYGPPGAGKKTRVMCILRELFGPSVFRIKVESRQLVVNKDTSRKIDVNIVSSVHHAEITPSESGNQDRVVIQEFLKQMAQTQQVDVNAKHRFHVVVINEADRLTRDAQAALRRTMEIYSRNLRLILLANTTSSIMAPIRSRALLIRVPAPTEAEVTSVLSDVAAQQSLSVESPATFIKIASASDRNLRRALLMLQSMNARSETIGPNEAVPLPDWQVVVNGVADTIVKSHTVQKLAEIRATHYQLLSHCIPAAVILKSLLFALLPRVEAKKRPPIIEYGALYDHRLRQGSKEIFHLEAFVARVMQVLQA